MLQEVHIFFEPTKKYGSDAYQFKIFNGSKRISKDIKASFPSSIDKNNLIVFFTKYVNNNNVKLLASDFKIDIDNNPYVEGIIKALAEQFELFITTDPDDVDNIMNEIYTIETSKYKNEKNADNLEDVFQQQKWKYTIVLLDDMEEQLEMLKDELNALFNLEFRYEVRVFAFKHSIDVILESHNMYVDVYVFDVARKPFHKWQTKEFDYFEYDLFKQIVTEKPNVLVKSKFYIYTRLPMSTIIREFDGADVECLQKQTQSIAEMARIVKEYIDFLYERESKIEEHFKNYK